MVYFVQAVNGGPIKIGFTSNFDQRIKALESIYGCSLAVLATMEGGRKEEAEIHDRFSHLRLGRTEQFQPASDLLTFIGRPLLVAANPNAVELMPPRPYAASKMEVVLFSEPLILKNLLRHGFATVVPMSATIADLVAKNTGRPISKQRISAIINSVRINDSTIEHLAKGLGLKAADLLDDSPLDL